jgi:hypothetical protein
MVNLASRIFHRTPQGVADPKRHRALSATQPDRLRRTHLRRAATTLLAAANLTKARESGGGLRLFLPTPSPGSV